MSGRIYPKALWENVEQTQMITCPSCGQIFYTTISYIRNNLLHATNDPLNCLCSECTEEWKDRKEEFERKSNLKSKEAFIYDV